jgi:O-antigen/teichoic acid export membrane protein
VADEDAGEAIKPIPPVLTPAQLGEVPSSIFEPLRSPDVGLRVIRGGAIRVAGYGVGMLLTAAASVLLLRYLGVADFGRYATVMSLIAIVGGLTDAGLSAIAGRDLAMRPAGEERGRLLANFLGLRLALTPLGALAAVAFAIAAGYERTLILGTVLAGVGLLLTSFQSTLTLPLSVELRIGRLTVIELVKQTAMLMGTALLVAAGAGLSAFFAISIVVGLVALAVTPPLVGSGLVWRPALDRVEWRGLIREVLPLAAAAVINVIYFRVLILLMSLLATAVATGLFATSFRVTEMLLAISSLVLTVALPVLAVAADDRTRLRYMLQRMIELAVITACFLVVVVVIVAEPVLRLLGGVEYLDAAPVLRIQVFALVPLFLGQACGVALIVIRRQSAVLTASAFALVLVLAFGAVLIPRHGATGAATAALIAETGLALALLLTLVRADPTLRPSFGFLWKVAVASGLAAATVLVPGLPDFGTGAIAALAYVAGLWFTRAIPREILDAFALRSPTRDAGLRPPRGDDRS